MTTSAPVLELTGERTRVRVLFRDLWSHRDLLGLLARQDYKSRYRSASLGLAWSVLMPLLQGVVIAVVFSRLVGGGLTRVYLPYVMSGVASFGYFSSSLTVAATSIVDSSGIAGRIYFPRLLLPAVAPTANLPGACVSFVIATVVALGLGRRPGWHLLLLPCAVLLLWLLAVVAGALLTLLHVYSRDVRYLVQAGLIVLFYATPLIYFLPGTPGTRALPQGLVPYVLANPATGAVQLMRLDVIGKASDVGPAVAITGAWIVALLVVTVMLYARRERTACDRL